MARVYDDPIPKPPETSARVMQFGATMALNPDGSVNKDQCYFSYVLDRYLEGGQGRERVMQRVYWPQAPQAMKDHLKALSGMCYEHAENQGLIAPGEDIDELSDEDPPV